jgi:hypothetical protein
LDKTLYSLKKHSNKINLKINKMETNNIKASRIEAAGNNFSIIGYTMILVIVISLGQFFYNKKISEQIQSPNSKIAQQSANYLNSRDAQQSAKDLETAFIDAQQSAKEIETASKDLETANYAASVLYLLCSIIILVNFISAGNNLSSCEELEADVIPNVESEKLLLKLNMTKSSSGKLANGGIIVYTDEKGEHGLVCSNNDLGNANWNSAKQLCDNYNEAGFSDWRLPTKDELQLIYLLLHRRKIGGFADNYYWSSTDDYSNYAWRQYGSSGDQTSLSKDGSCNVRAVRAF